MGGVLKKIYQKKNAIDTEIETEMLRSNEEEIKSRFATLLTNVKSALEANHVQTNDVRTILVEMFTGNDKHIPNTNLDEIFSAVSSHKLWDCWHHSPVGKLLNCCLPDHVSMITQYKEYLAGFCTMNELIKYLKQTNIDPSGGCNELPLESYTKEQYQKLRAAIGIERNITTLSLKYVQDLWQQFAEEFKIPFLSVVLDIILGDNCVGDTNSNCKTEGGPHTREETTFDSQQDNLTPNMGHHETKDTLCARDEQDSDCGTGGMCIQQEEMFDDNVLGEREDRQTECIQGIVIPVSEQVSTVQQNEIITFEDGELRNHQLLSPVTSVKEEVEEYYPVALLPVETEEAITDTHIHDNAETMCAQPTMPTWNLCGVEVCGEMTVVVYSSHDQQITWTGYGLNLNIPKGCLPAGMEQCTINIKASLAGQYEFPENSHLISAIFWLHCEDVHKFIRPITVEIQHCAMSKKFSNLKLKFVQAGCNCLRKRFPYRFRQIFNGFFNCQSSYGVVEVNNFQIGIGIVQEGPEDREYCSQLFYLGQPNQCNIHYVVTWNIAAHLTVIKNEYGEKGAILGLHQPVEFESDTVSLDIPMEGIAVKGWKITPLIRPMVTKKQVDNFREGKLTPCCQLKAQVVGRRKKISHQVTLQGAKYPHNIFTINLPAEDPDSQPVQTFGDLGFPLKKRRRLKDAEHSI